MAKGPHTPHQRCYNEGQIMPWNFSEINSNKIICCSSCLVKNNNSLQFSRIPGIVLYCTVLYCTVLYYTVLYCTVLYCNVLYCTVLYCTVLYCTVLYCTVLYCTVLYCTVLYCTVHWNTWYRKNGNLPLAPPITRRGILLTMLWTVQYCTVHFVLCVWQTKGTVLHI